MCGALPPPPNTRARANILAPTASTDGAGAESLVGPAVRRRHRVARASACLPDAANVVASPLGRAPPWPCRGLARNLLLFLHSNRFRHRADDPRPEGRFSMQHREVFSTPERRTAVAPTRVTTTLYDVMAALQSVVEPEEDEVVVAIVAAWLRSGRLRVPEDAPIAA